MKKTDSSYHTILKKKKGELRVKYLKIYKIWKIIWENIFLNLTLNETEAPGKKFFKERHITTEKF